MSFTINAKTNIAKISKEFTTLQKKQLPFAISLALNDVAKSAQSFMIKRIPTIFNNSVRRWYDPRQKTGIRIAFSSKSDLISAVYCKAHFAQIQEEGGIKLPHRGTNIAIPTMAIPEYLRSSATLKTIMGERGIFKRGKSIYRRLGSGRLRRLYSLALQARIKPRFYFKARVAAVFHTRFNAIFNKNFSYAMKTAKRY